MGPWASLYYRFIIINYFKFFRLICMLKTKNGKFSMTDHISLQSHEPVESLEGFLEKLRSDPLLDILRDGIVVMDDRKKVRFMNRHAQELLKISESDAEGESCYEVIRSEICEGTCSQCLEHDGVLFMENFNVDVLTRSGEVVACCMHTTVLHDSKSSIVGYIEHFREMGQVREIIDQQSELLKLYSHEKEKVQAIINSMGDGVFTIGMDSRIRSFSRRLEEMTGWREGDLLGRDCSEILLVSSPENGLSEARFATGLKEGMEIRDQRYEVLTSNGDSVPVLLSTNPLKDSGNELVGVMGIVRDLRELEGLKRELEDRYSFSNIIGTGHGMQEIFELIERISDTNTNVLIQGESGTGKELVARALHFHSPRKDKPFLKINCAALPDPLLESELFGYEKGAFTGATRRKPGKFKLADGGTIFLDEVGETTGAFQAKLLRVVQDLEFEPLGGTEVEKVDVRILAATNKNLKEEVAAGRFREDLYYRLCVVPVFLPPLRDRREDIPILIDHFLEKVVKKYPSKKIQKPVISPPALSLMMDYDWPGNVRELENAVERAFVCSTTEMIDTSALPREIREPSLSIPRFERTTDVGPSVDWDLVARIQESLSQCKGNKTLAAKKLGISRTTLWRRLQEMEKEKSKMN